MNKPDHEPTAQHSNNENEESLIDFPCQLTVRVMGENCTKFQQAVVDIAQQHDPKFCAAQHVKLRNSKTGKYISVNLDIYATSKAQLNALYQALGDCKQTLWTL
ncbi:MAG: HP0495 family protein [bacterium]